MIKSIIIITNDQIASAKNNLQMYTF